MYGRKNKDLRIILIIYIIIVVIRLFFAFQTDNYISDGSYFALRQVEHISDYGVPLFQDTLSYGGRDFIFSPFYYYVLAFFNLFLPLTIVAKVIPNVIAATTIFFTYLISHEISRNRKVAIFTAVFSAFIPAFFSETINSITPYSLVIPLTLAVIYFFMRLESDKRYAMSFIVALFLLALSHISSHLIIGGLIIYLFFIYLEKLKTSKGEMEAILFSVFLVLWSQFIIYKKAFLLYGPNIILQNIPPQLIINYFQNISLIETLNKIGIIPLIFGIYVIYKYTFKEKKRNIYLILSFTIIISLMLWFRLIPLTIGLIFAGILLIILFSQNLKLVLLFIQKTKFSKYENLLLGGIVVIFIITSVIPAFYYANLKISDSFSKEEINALKWIRENTPKDSVILASYTEGSIINYYAERKNVIDTQFLMAENTNRRFIDVQEIYSTNLETKAIKLITKYSIDYIYLSDRTKETYEVKNIAYFSDKSCFKVVFENDAVQIIEPLCLLEEE